VSGLTHVAGVTGSQVGPFPCQLAGLGRDALAALDFVAQVGGLESEGELPARLKRSVARQTVQDLIEFEDLLTLLFQVSFPAQPTG
jgi:hypothetical protein